MSIELGQKAPNFSLVSNKKEVIQLSDFLGESSVLLVFFPGAFTSVCTTELNDINNSLDEYNGAQVLGISTDSPFVLDEFSKANALSYPLLSDHNSEASVAYGTKYNPGEFVLGLDRISRRAAFVVDKDGIVRYAEVLESAGNLPNFDAIKEVLATC